MTPTKRSGAKSSAQETSFKRRKQSSMDDYLSSVCSFSCHFEKKCIYFVYIYEKVLHLNLLDYGLKYTLSSYAVCQKLVVCSVWGYEIIALHAWLVLLDIQLDEPKGLPVPFLLGYTGILISTIVL